MSVWEVNIGAIVKAAHMFKELQEGLSDDEDELAKVVETLSQDWSGGAWGGFKAKFDAWLAEGTTIEWALGEYARILGLDSSSGIAGIYMDAHLAIGGK